MSSWPAMRALPGVESAAAVTLRPLWGTVGMDWPFTVEGQSPKDAERNPLFNFETVTPDYFRVMGIPLKHGRAFEERDREGQPGVVVVSEALARRYWPGQDPIGKRLKIPLPPTRVPRGVADGHRRRGRCALPRAAGPPASTSTCRTGSRTTARTTWSSAHSGDVTGLPAALQRVVRELDPDSRRPRSSR